MTLNIIFYSVYSLYFYHQNQLTQKQFSESIEKIENALGLRRLKWCAIEMQHLLHMPYVNEVTLNGQNQYVKSC